MIYTIPKNDDLFVFREEEDGALIFFRKKNKLEVLNRTGAAIFKLLYEKKMDKTMLLNEFKKLLIGEIPNDEILIKDISDFLDSLKKMDILLELEEE